MLILSNIKINILELKIRIIYIFFSFLSTFIIFFNYKIELFFFITKDFLNKKNQFVYTNLLDPIYIYIKLTLIFSIFFCIPVITYFIITFLFKGLYNFYIKTIMTIIICYYFNNIFILYFCYTKFLPILLNFLIELEKKNTNTFQLLLLPTGIDYLKLFIDFLLFFHFSFLIINIFFLLSKFLSLEILNNKKYVYLITFIIFLIIAPPDFFVQINIFPILIIIIELSIYLNLFFFNIFKNIDNTL